LQTDEKWGKACTPYKAIAKVHSFAHVTSQWKVGEGLHALQSGVAMRKTALLRLQTGIAMRKMTLLRLRSGVAMRKMTLQRLQSGVAM
jgi:hypothetical protein